MGDRQPLFHARGLTKTYRMGDVDVHALQGVDLDLYPGEFVVIFGPSGSGKSTLLNILGGLDAPTSGTVQFRDHRLVGARTLGLGNRFELDVSIVLWEAESVLKVPSTALVPADSAWAVYVVDHGRAKLRPVVVARRGVREVQIDSGLTAGDRVIVHPDERVKDGVRVRPSD